MTKAAVMLATTTMTSMSMMCSLVVQQRYCSKEGTAVLIWIKCDASRGSIEDESVQCRRPAARRSWRISRSPARACNRHLLWRAVEEYRHDLACKAVQMLARAARAIEQDMLDTQPAQRLEPASNPVRGIEQRSLLGRLARIGK